MWLNQIREKFRLIKNGQIFYPTFLQQNHIRLSAAGKAHFIFEFIVLFAVFQVWSENLTILCLLNFVQIFIKQAILQSSLEYLYLPWTKLPLDLKCGKWKVWSDTWDKNCKKWKNFSSKLTLLFSMFGVLSHLTPSAIRI